MKPILFFLFIFLPMIALGQTQDSVIYHSYFETTSSYKIEEWNINSEKLPKLYLEEKIDQKGRVTQLRFFSNGKVLNTTLCYLAPWYRFQYPNDSTIVVSNLNSLGEIGGDVECGTPSKTTFIFNPDNYELKFSSSENILSDRMKEIWLSQISEDELDSLIEQSKTETDSPRYIFPYLFSYQKFKGLFLIDSKIDLETVYLSEKIKTRVLETLPNWYAH